MDRQDIIAAIRAHKAAPGTSPMAGNGLPLLNLPGDAMPTVDALIAEDVVRMVELNAPDPAQDGRRVTRTYLYLAPEQVEGVTTEITEVAVNADADGVHVQPVWSNVDRPISGGWAVKDMRMAKRLERALLAGVVYPEVKVLRDANGQTYVSGSAKVMGRYMNADLKRLGY